MKGYPTDSLVAEHLVDRRVELLGLIKVAYSAVQKAEKKVGELVVQMAALKGEKTVVMWAVNLVERLVDWSAGLMVDYLAALKVE